MAEFKKGQKVKIDLRVEGSYWGPSSGVGYDLVDLDGGPAGAWARVPSSAIEVIEEPYEEGAIYEADGNYGGHWLWAYLPDESEKPWVFISGTPYLNFGHRFGEPSANPRKLAPLAQ